MSMTAITKDVRVRLEAADRVYDMNEVIALCPDLTWNQVFLAIDHLSRTGQIELRRDPTQGYRVKLRSPIEEDRSVR